MAIEATIVEQLQELRRWQIQQQQELIRHQQEQREMLSNEQNRMYQALSLSVEEMSLSEQSLKELIDHKKEEIESDLIDLDTPDEEYSSPVPHKSNNFNQYRALINQSNNNKSVNLKVPKVQLSLKNAKTDSKPNVDYNNSMNQHDYSSEVSIDGVQSFPCGKSEKLHISIDEIPVPSPKKDFNTLLEERLKDDEAVNVEIQNKPVIKRPFLKKGQGLTRFMPGSNNEKVSKKKIRPRSASFTTGTQSNNSKSIKTNLGRCNSLPRSKKNEVSRKSISNIAPVAQQKLTLKNVPLPKKTARTKSINTVSSPLALEKKNLIEVVSDPNSSDLEFKSKKELEEVRIFELLEDKAENSSFCSTSSTVIAFLQQSTPLKHKALLHSVSKQKVSLPDIGDETLEEIIHTTKPNNVSKSQSKEKSIQMPKWNNIPTTKLKNDKAVTGAVLPNESDAYLYFNNKYESDEKSNQDENNLSLHVRFSEYNEYKTMTDTSSISSDSQTVIDYINDKGAWSDCSATPDSSDVESIVSLQSQVDHVIDEKNKIEHLNLLKKDQDDSDEDETVNVKISENNEEHEEDVADEIESQNTTLQKDETIIEQKIERASLFNSELLKSRLLELEQEIEIFRKESAALILQRKKLQEERTKLQEERIGMQRKFKQKEETLEIEKKKTENILQEERKRLAREKAALESRMKDAYEKAQKSKQERQEIQMLRDQLEELKEEYSQKESKWSATNASQRSQMRVLQTENSKLKQELEKLQQKKNARFKRPAASTNTKAIHQISKFLADRKKISPFKNDDPIDEDEVRVPETADTNYDIEVVNDEDKFEEKKSEKTKILKSAESIARTRNLYENLLRDATVGFSGIYNEKKNLLNQPMNTPALTLLNDHSNDEENDTKLALTEKSQNDSSENYDDEKDIKTEEQAFNTNKQGIREVHHPDGRVEYWYPNGNVKKVFPDKCFTKMIYYNGDVRETDQNGTVKYFYAATRTWHTTMPDGLEILEFPDGQVERRSKDGTIEVAFPDGSVRIVQADGSEKWALRDGTIAETSVDGEKVLTLPNGQREIHTKDHKRREYPDGTVKIIYPDGVQETRYANGRIRLKDKDGNLIMDSGHSSVAT